MGIPNDGTGLVAVLLRAPGDVAYGADGDATGAAAEFAGQAGPDLLLGGRPRVSGAR
jgi:hypothetical protein